MTDVPALLLAAGLGSRLRPITDNWPKCLVPVGSRPLLEHWLCTLTRVGISRVLVNTHHHYQIVDEFLARPQFKDWVYSVYEEVLLGTAGTIRENLTFFGNETILLSHADNWCQCEFSDFLNYHQTDRPDGTVMTMMTFRTNNPKDCGIVTLDENDIAVEILEKVKHPPDNLANAAVYVLEPEVTSWISKQLSVTDFSTQVVPHFLGRIATWENTQIHRDIGTIKSLIDAQLDPQPENCWVSDEWLKSFENHSIHSVFDSAIVPSA